MYMIKLMGGTIEDIPDVYDKERSPIWHANKITKPLLVRHHMPYASLMLTP